MDNGLHYHVLAGFKPYHGLHNVFFHGGMVLKFWVRCAIMRCSIVLLAGISLDTISPLRFLTYPDWTYPKVYALNNMPGYIF